MFKKNVERLDRTEVPNCLTSYSSVYKSPFHLFYGHDPRLLLTLVDADDYNYTRVILTSNLSNLAQTNIQKAQQQQNAHQDQATCHSWVEVLSFCLYTIPSCHTYIPMFIKSHSYTKALIKL